jgi:predicted MPP superfamily phosphohydrolase
MYRRAAAALVAASGAGTLGYSLWEARQYTLRRFEIPMLPDGSRPLRVLHLSDLHLTPDQSAKRAWVRSLAGLEPDLVINTGDNLAHPEAVPWVLDAYEPLFDRPGGFVMGSNDYWAPVVKNPLRYLAPGPTRRIHGDPLPTEDLRRGLVAAGWTDLNNVRATLKVADGVVELVGVDDPHIFRDRYEDVTGPPDPAADVTLGVTHAPYRRVLDAMTNDAIPLVLAGHTHGGQVCLPGWGALTTNCDLPTRQAKGVSRHDDAWLHVSAGLGCSPYAPVRLACRPEATLLTLTSVGAAAGAA